MDFGGCEFDLFCGAVCEFGEDLDGDGEFWVGRGVLVFSSSPL
jgi:hypothetical protein